MAIIAYFQSICSSNVLLGFVILYLVLSILYSAHFNSCYLFDKPVLFKSFNLFSLLFISLIFYLFCFDFDINDNMFFFNQNIQLLFIFIMIFVLLCSRDFLIAKNMLKYEYDMLLLFIMFSGVSLCFSNEFLFIYLALELQGLTLFVFAAFNRNSEYATEAGLKYFIFGALMSCFLLFGFGLIYLHFGSLSFELISSIINFNYNPFLFVGFLFVIIVLMFKLGAAPFHFWLCDVYEGAILAVTLLFASAPKIVLFALLFKICFFVLFDYNLIWSLLIGFSAILSIIVGSVSAIYQKRLKRLFAYSTIAHTGFILLAFLCFSLASAKALIFYILIYSLLTIATFSILINMSLLIKIQPKYLINLASIGSKNYIFAINLTILMLSIAGIPPLMGFFNKFLILLTLIGAQYYFIAFLIICFSSVACYYYIRLIKIMFFALNTKNTIWVTNITKQNT